MLVVLELGPAAPVGLVRPGKDMVFLALWLLLLCRDGVEAWKVILGAVRTMTNRR